MFKRLVLFLVISFISSASIAQTNFDVDAKQAILLDVSTNQVLFEKNADEKAPTSSMSKVMTLYMIFDALHDKRIKLEDKFRVSKRAFDRGGSSMFLKYNEKAKVLDLIKGVAIQSGNDAAITLAEGLYGSESAFSQYMTEVAHEMGMTNSNFMNASGWPDPDHYSTVRDLSTLAYNMITKYPEYYYVFSQKNFEYNGIKQGNRNPLLYRNMNVDGIKTGHTEDGGYGLMSSANRNGRRLIAVLNGMKSMQVRADESAKLLEWGYNYFRLYSLIDAGKELGTVDVFLGAEEEVPFALEKDLKRSLSMMSYEKMKITIEKDSSVKAPILKGEQVATLKLSVPGYEDIEYPLFATKDVKKAGFMKKLKESVKGLFN